MMANLILGSFLSGMLGVTLLMVSLFLILLILVQRGRGGGLTGALGGPGGQSAFGTKAGDLFTRVTGFVALGWISLCAFTMWSLGPKPIQAITPGSSVSATSAGTTDVSKDFIDLGDGDAMKSETPAGDVELTPAMPPSESTAPVMETPSIETPSIETPAIEAPAIETEAAETPAAETPAADKAQL